MFSLSVNAHRPKRQGNKNEMFICITQRPSRPHPPPPAAGLRPRGDESDQSDQSTEITVILGVRKRAAGHSEFTHPTQALDKSVQEWQTCARPERKSLDPPHKDLFMISTFARMLPTTSRAGAVKPHHL